MIGSQCSRPAMEFLCSEIETIGNVWGLVEWGKDWNSVGANSAHRFRSLGQSPTHRKLTDIRQALGGDGEIEHVDVVRVTSAISDSRDRPRIHLRVIELDETEDRLGLDEVENRRFPRQADCRRPQ